MPESSWEVCGFGVDVSSTELMDFRRSHPLLGFEGNEKHPLKILDEGE